MRPFLGVLLELVGLSVLLSAASNLSLSSPQSYLLLLLAQALTTVLVHCPAHYVVGVILGIKFRAIRLRRSSVALALPASMRRVGSLLVVPSLLIERDSRATTPPGSLRAMYLAGVSGSVSSAVVFATAVSLTGAYPAILLAWLFAIGYGVSDFRLSPTSGDAARARALSGPEPSR